MNHTISTFPPPRRQQENTAHMYDIPASRFFFSLLIFSTTCLLWFAQIEYSYAELLFAEHFENYQSWSTEGSGTGKIAEITSTQALSNDGNNKAFHVFFPQTAWSSTSSGKRIEIKHTDTQLTAWNAERWYSLSVFVPAGYGRTEGKHVDEHIAFQFHGTPDNVDNCSCPGTCDTYRSPPLALLIEPSTTGNTWKMEARYSEEQYNCDGNSSVIKIDLSPYLTEEFPAVQEGSWTTWIYHILWDPFVDGNGHLEAWVRDAAHPHTSKIVDYTGPIGFYDTVPPYIKIGIYHWSSEWPATVSSLELFFDRFLVGTSKDDMPWADTNFYVLPHIGVLYF